MPNNERWWHNASDFLLVVAVAAVALGLGTIGVGLTASVGAVPPTRAFASRSLNPEATIDCPLAATIADGCGQTHAAGSPGAAPRAEGPDTRAVRRSAAERVPPPIWPSAAKAGPPLLPSSDEDPRQFLAHMSAVTHRQGLPLPASEGRMQSLIDQPASGNDDPGGR